MRCRNQNQPALFAVGRGAQILNPGLCVLLCAPCKSSSITDCFSGGEGGEDSEIFRLCPASCVSNAPASADGLDAKTHDFSDLSLVIAL